MPDSIDASRKSPQWTRWLSMILGIALLALVLYESGLNQLDELPELRISAFLAVALFIVISVILFSIRWYWIIRTVLNLHPNPLRILNYSLTSIVLGNLFAETATVVVVRSGLLARREGIPLHLGAPSVLVDKLFDLGLVILYFLPALGFVFDVISLSTAIYTTIALTMAALFGLFYLYEPFINIGKRIIQQLLRFKWISNVTKRDAVQKILSRVSSLQLFVVMPTRTMIPAYILTVVGEIFLVLRSYYVAQSVGLDVPIGVMLLGVILAQASLIIAITPGGLGILEGTWYVVLISVGITDSNIAIFLILHRLLITLTSVLMWGVVYFFVWLKPTPVHTPKGE